MDNTSSTNQPMATPPVNQASQQSVVPPTGDPVKKSNKAIIIVVVLLLLFLVLVIVAVSRFGTGNRTPVNELPQENSAVQETAPTVTEAPISTEISEGLTITITEPTDKSTVTTATVSVKGTASANADVFVNEKELRADAAGKFTTTVGLDEGENVISITANDADGNYAEKDITVTYEPEE